MRLPHLDWELCKSMFYEWEIFFRVIAVQATSQSLYVIAFGHLPEVEGENLLLKRPDMFDIYLKRNKLIWLHKYPPWRLALTVSEGVVQAFKGEEQ